MQLQGIKQKSLAKIPEVSSEETRTFPHTRARAQPSKNVFLFVLFERACFYIFSPVLLTLKAPGLRLVLHLLSQACCRCSCPHFKSFSLWMTIPHQTSRCRLPLNSKPEPFPSKSNCRHKIPPPVGPASMVNTRQGRGEKQKVLYARFKLEKKAGKLKARSGSRGATRVVMLFFQAACKNCICVTPQRDVRCLRSCMF